MATAAALPSLTAAAIAARISAVNLTRNQRFGEFVLHGGSVVDPDPTEDPEEKKVVSGFGSITRNVKNILQILFNGHKIRQRLI